MATVSSPKGHSINDLQVILSEQINRIASGDVTPASVNAIVNATGAILRTVKMQMDYAKMIGKTPNIPLLFTSTDE